MHRRHAIYRALAPALCAFLAACSTLSPLPAGQELAISLPAQSSHPDINVVRTDSGGGGVAGGVLGGGAGVAAAAGCGLLVFVCLPVFALGGAVLGGTAGTLAESAAGPKRATLEDLDKRLAAYARANDPRQEFLSMVVDKASRRWQVVPGPAKNSLTVHLTGLSLQAESTESSEHISLAMRVVIVMRTPETAAYNASPAQQPSAWPQSAPPVLTQTFEYRGPPADIGLWMDGSGEFLKAAIARAYEEIAQQVIAGLSGKAASAPLVPSSHGSRA